MKRCPCVYCAMMRRRKARSMKRNPPEIKSLLPLVLIGGVALYMVSRRGGFPSFPPFSLVTRPAPLEPGQQLLQSGIGAAGGVIESLGRKISQWISTAEWPTSSAEPELVYSPYSEPDYYSSIEGDLYT